VAKEKHTKENITFKSELYLKDTKWRCNMTPFVLLLGLGVHALFEGLALGIEPKYEKATILGLAIVLHKASAGMSLGISM
jgi:zinc transporter 1/2/3